MGEYVKNKKKICGLLKYCFLGAVIAIGSRERPEKMDKMPKFVRASRKSMH